MKIYNTTTGKEVSLVIIDPKTGIEWTADLIGNAGDLTYNSVREMNEMDQENIDWWASTINGLNRIEDLKKEVEGLLSYDEYVDLLNKLEDVGSANDYEMHIRDLTEVLTNIIRLNS